jgi:hypothetical protein
VIGPWGMNRRAFDRRAAQRAKKGRIRPGATLDGAHMQRHPPTGTRKREVVAMARALTGRPNIGWKAAKKFGKRIERRARAARAGAR